MAQPALHHPARAKPLERQALNPSTIATMGALRVNMGIAHNMNAALNHIPHEGLRQAPGNKAGNPTDPIARRLTYITQPDTIEKIKPKPKMSSTAWFQ
jgi:hypothetical protein